MTDGGGLRWGWATAASLAAHVLCGLGLIAWSDGTLAPPLVRETVMLVDLTPLPAPPPASAPAVGEDLPPPAPPMATAPQPVPTLASAMPPPPPPRSRPSHRPTPPRPAKMPTTPEQTAPASPSPAPSPKASDAPQAAPAAPPVHPPPPTPTPPTWRLGSAWTPAPPYPPAARARRAEGRVVLEVHTQPDGSVAHVAVAASSGSPDLDHAALRTVAGWRFGPAKRGDQAVAAVVAVGITFALR